MLGRVGRDRPALQAWVVPALLIGYFFGNIIYVIGKKIEGGQEALGITILVGRYSSSKKCEKEN